MPEVRVATAEDLETIWNRNLAEHPQDLRWCAWKEEYIAINRSGDAVTFVVVCDGEPVGEGTLLLSPSCSAIGGRTVLADGKRAANVNALRICKAYERIGYVSAMVRKMERYAAALGYTRLTIGVAAKETRNLAIYLHWGYTEFLMSELEEGELVLYYGKNLPAAQ